DDDYQAVPETSAMSYRTVVSIRSLGVDDYYDMTVPGLQNYAAQGIWNHNTIQTVGDLIAAMVFIPPIGGAVDAIAQVFYWDTLAAWMHARSTGRVARSGWARPFEVLAADGDRAY